MLSKSAIAKVKALFIINVIIVAMAAGSYFYLQNTGELAVGPKPAEFTLADLTINPLEAEVGEPILISVNVTNVGEEEGNYSAYLMINDVLKGNQTLLLSSGASNIVEFTVIETAEGNYTVKIGGLSGFLKIKAASPTTSSISLSNLLADPYEAWVGDPISIKATASNLGAETDSLSVKLMIDGSVIEAKTVQLAAGETTVVEFTVNATSEGQHSVKMNTLTGSFVIVPTGKHTLLVRYSGGGSTPMPFTLDGVSYTMPYTELLPVGTHTLTMPVNFESKTAIFQFVYWSDGDTNPTKTINLQSRVLIVVQYRIVSGHACCPSLSVWNGTNYVYRTEVSAGTGYLPYFKYFGEKGTMVFGYSDPWDYIKLDRNQIQPRNGYYDMILTQIWDEIFYMDSARLLVVDHLPDVDVYSTGWTRKYNLEGQGTIYAVSKNPSPPISAVYGGENVLAQISKLDGICTTRPSDWEYQYHWDTLELNLGDLSNAKEIKLIVAGMVIWPTSEVTAEWVAKFVNLPGEPPFPVQFMEVKDANGSWVRVPDNRQFPMLDAAPETYVVNLTGLFPTNDYSLRINMFFDARFDYIGVDTTPQQDMKIREINPSSATLTQIFETYSTSTGNFTSYGDVTELMLKADDKFVIGRRGDEIRLLFPANIEPVPAGMERDYFLFASCWFKVPGLPYLPFTVDPLPFHAMSAFPYSPTENYPYDAAHLSYLLEYNTREITILDVEARANDITSD